MVSCDSHRPVLSPLGSIHADTIDAAQLHAARSLPRWQIFDAQRVTRRLLKVNTSFIDMAFAEKSQVRFRCFVYRELAQLLLLRLC